MLLWCLSAQAILAAEYAVTHYIPLRQKQETHFGNKVTCFDHSILKAAGEHILLFCVLAGEGRTHQFPPFHLLRSCTLFLSSWLAPALTHTQSSLSNLFSTLLQLRGLERAKNVYVIISKKPEVCSVPVTLPSQQVRSRRDKLGENYFCRRLWPGEDVMLTGWRDALTQAWAGRQLRVLMLTLPKEAEGPFSDTHTVRCALPHPTTTVLCHHQARRCGSPFPHPGSRPAAPRLLAPSPVLRKVQTDGEIGGEPAQGDPAFFKLCTPAACSQRVFLEGKTGY